MKIKEFVIKLAILYNTPIVIKELQSGRELDNPKLLYLEDWLNENFVDGERLKKFYDYFIKNFTPTVTVPFPVPASMEFQHNQYQTTWTINDYRKNPEGGTMDLLDLAGKNYAENEKVTLAPPEQYKDVDISVVAEDAKHMTHSQLLKKYGVVICGELWSDGFYNRKDFYKRRNKENERKQKSR